MALLKGQREILLTITGFFIMLPALLLNALRPFVPSGKGEGWAAEIAAWTEANFIWIVLVAVLAALGRLAMLILLLGPERPTVGEALMAGAKLLLMFVVMDLLIDIRKEARANKDFVTSDKIRNQLSKAGILLKDDKDGNISWEIA